MIEQLPTSINQSIWQTILDSNLPAQPGCEEEAIRLVFESISPLGSPAPWQDRLAKAIGRATSKAKERSRKNGAICIRVMASGKAVEAGEKDSFQGDPGSEARGNSVRSQKPPQGWNFFVVERSLPDQPESHSGTADENQHVVEIFLYIEG